ncbi:hypothetical protein [Streptomyces acidiscabies]|nr:hypothetical protein [Streptomyces acidiscabies]
MPTPECRVLADGLANARPQDFAERFRQAVTDDFGAVAQLHQLLEAASEWCRAHGDRGSAAELDAVAGRLTDLGEELHLVGDRVQAALARSLTDANGAGPAPALPPPSSPAVTAVAHRSR